MSIQENIENYAKWPNAKLIALSESSDEFKNILSEVEAYRLENSKEVDLNFKTLDHIINYVKNYDRSEGEIRVRFYDNWVYSINIAQEDYYTLLIGHSREKQIVYEYRHTYSIEYNTAKARENAVNNLDYRIEEGKKYIDSKKHNLWQDFVEDLSDPNNASFYNNEIDNIIEIIKLMNDQSEESIEDALEFLLDKYYLSSQITYKVVETVTKFSNNGVAFAKHYLELLKKNNDPVEVTSGFEDLIEYTKKINEIINEGTVAPELVFNVSDRLYYMPIIFDEGIHDIYLLEIGEGLYEGTLDGNLVTVVYDDQFLDIKIINGNQTHTFKTTKENKPLKVDEHIDSIATGHKAIIYFTEIKDFDKAIEQAVLNNKAESNINVNYIAKAYGLKKKRSE
ncbi:MAG: hypothetical protein J1F35_03025 [Erysipelotrichales bacterium]|nr:hypothetical protein [Erysipelotrichales bacterium]